MITCTRARRAPQDPPAPRTSLHPAVRLPAAQQQRSSLRPAGLPSRASRPLSSSALPLGRPACPHAPRPRLLAVNRRDHTPLAAALAHNSHVPCTAGSEN
jgi:hypothetical protein